MNRLTWMLFKARLAFEDPKNRAWDAAHQVETAREEPLGEAGVGADDVSRGNGVYRVTWGALVDRALGALDIDPTGWRFLDYGSGKGKAMLMAADYPFAEVIGIEYARGLHETAAANCRTFVSDRQQCRVLTPVLGDVLDYEPPAGPIVCFMCNPFDGPTLARVFDLWRARHAAGAGDIRILYLNMRDVAEQGAVLGRQDWLKPVARARQYVVLAPR